MSIYCTRSAESNQADLFLFAWFKTHSGACGDVQAHPKGSLPIIVVTADTALDLRQRCLADGADEVLFKPVAMDSLFDAIGRMLAKGSGDGMIG